MDAVIIAQGNELTTGAVVDTNSNWLCGQLWALGLSVRRVLTAPDRLDDLIDIIAQAATLAPVVVCTGGLGPTRDDLTAEAAARAFGGRTARDPEALASIEAMYARWGRTMAESNRKQADLPEGARMLANRWGTAPGFAVTAPGCTLYFLPGVPREMKPMFETWVAPDILATQAIAAPVQHSIRVLGVPESELEMVLRGLELPGLEIGFRARVPDNEVKLLFSPEVSATAREATVAEAMRRIGPRAFGVDCGDLAELVGALLVERGETLALAESCTAGGLAAWVASVPGASRYLLEGAVVYADAAKVRCCGVSQADLAAHGAVSEPVALQLAAGMKARSGATWAIGITGIAGPGGGSVEKPVGTVHIALAGPEGLAHRLLKLPGDRSRITRMAAASALALLLRHLSGEGAYLTSKG